MEKPTLPKGTRDFGPAVMVKRQYILDTIRKVFQKFGFQPLETPAMENLSTLTGKYGDEGDQLLFRILNSGDFLKKIRYKALFRNPDDIVSATFLGDLVKELKKTGLNSFEEVLTQKTLTPELLNRFSDFYTNNKVVTELLYSKFSDGTISEYDFVSYLDQLFQYFLTMDFIRDSKAKTLTGDVSEKGLRYDLTVPFARYVVMNRHEIAFPFKRYQVQPVWRADRPQKGRYREFYQCDADVVGTDSLICEAEIILMIKEVMTNLNVKDFTIKINHRGVLNGIADFIGATGKEADLFVAIDKLDKMGEEKVREELTGKGFSTKSLDTLFSILKQSGSNDNKLNFLTTQFQHTASGQKGTKDLKEVFELLKSFGANDNNVELDIALARGLSYYTGCIFEVKINNVSIGSIVGGGRYDNLTTAFGDKDNLSGTGFSFGIDRIYDALDELNLFPKETQVSSKILICHLDEAAMKFGLKALTSLRKAGISSELYPEQAKLKKQLDYANKKLIPFTIVIGEDEMKSEQLGFKNMETGEQEKLTIEQIILKLNK